MLNEVEVFYWLGVLSRAKSTENKKLILEANKKINDLRGETNGMSFKIKTSVN